MLKIERRAFDPKNTRCVIVNSSANSTIPRKAFI
jgi:hypothetical protein